VIVLLALLLNAAPARAAEPVTPPVPGAVDSRVWRDLAASPEHNATVVVVLHEPVAGDPASAISAQMGLEETLAALQRLGSVKNYTAYYGANAIVVTASRAALHLLADWPSIAAIHPYEPGQPWELAVEPPAAGEATGQITGLVTGPDGTTPLSGIRVTAYRQTSPGLWSVAGTASSAANGSYSIGSLVTGIYRAKFESLTGVYVTEYYDNKSTFNLATNFSVTDGQTTANINASLAQAGYIAGRVTDLATGSGVGDIVVGALINDGGTWRTASSAVTISNGNYTLGGLAGGQSYIVRFSDGLAPPRFLDEYYDNVTTIGAATPVNVAGGQTTANINAAMGSYGKIAGTITGPDGTTVAANIDVDVYQYDDVLGQWEWVSGDATTTTGTYEATGLVTGNYRLYFSDPVFFFSAEYYNNKPDLATADDVPVQLGLLTSGINASLASAQVQVSKSLPAGWNMVAPPVHPVDATPAGALASINGSYTIIYSYNGCDTVDPWKKYDPYAPPFVNDLTTIDPRYGYWLNMTAPVTLVFNGAWPQIIGIPLCPGWNLISYPKQTAVPIATALAGIAGKFNLVYAYDAADLADPWKKYDPNAPPFTNDLTHMQAWFGYWIRMTQAATLVVTNR
jgi:hypothetical protein